MPFIEARAIQAFFSIRSRRHNVTIWQTHGNKKRCRRSSIFPVSRESHIKAALFFYLLLPRPIFWHFAWVTTKNRQLGHGNLSRVKKTVAAIVVRMGHTVICKPKIVHFAALEQIAARPAWNVNGRRRCPVRLDIHPSFVWAGGANIIMVERHRPCQPWMAWLPKGHVWVVPLKRINSKQYCVKTRNKTV